MASTTYSETTALCIRSMDLMTEGTREDFEPVYHPEGVNREAAVEPPATRQPGPAGFWATAQWLREAFSGLRFEIHEAVERDDLVVLHVTMSGRHTGDFVELPARHRRSWTASCRRPARRSPSPRPTGSALGTA